MPSLRKIFPAILYCKKKFKRLIGEKIKEISAAISYHEEKRSKKFTISS